MELIEDIAEAVTTAIPGSTVYIEALPRNADEPCFFIRELKTSVSRMVGERWRVETRFKIEYYPADKLRARNECDETAAALFEALERVETDFGLMRGVDRTYGVEEGRLKFEVSFEYFIRRGQNTPAMGILEQKHRSK